MSENTSEIEPNKQRCCNHNNCVVAIIRGARNGFYYGSRLRFAHAFVMGVLFGKGTMSSRFIWALKMALRHGKILALFAFTYKTVQCILANLRGKADAIHSFIGGVIGSWVLLKMETDMSINTQVGYYLSARVCEGIVLLLMKRKQLPDVPLFNLTYTIIWGLVMFLFELDAKILNRSLASSMVFLYKNSDEPLRSYKQLIPFDTPKFLL